MKDVTAAVIPRSPGHWTSNREIEIMQAIRRPAGGRETGWIPGHVLDATEMVDRRDAATVDAGDAFDGSAG